MKILLLYCLSFLRSSPFPDPILPERTTLLEQGIHVRTLDGLVNTKGLGKFALVLIGLLSGLAEVERSLIQERTLESIQHRRSTGGNLGGQREDRYRSRNHQKNHS